MTVCVCYSKCFCAYMCIYMHFNGQTNYVNLHLSTYIRMYVCQSALNMYRVFIWEGIMYLPSEPIHYIHIDAATYLNRLSTCKADPTSQAKCIS